MKSVELKYSTPLLEGKFIKRYKRFLADVRLKDGREITVHCPNSGSMKTCAEPGCPVIISDSQNPARKLRYTWEMIQMGRTWVGVNTMNPNVAVPEFIQAGKIPELAGYATLKREVKYGKNSRIDALLSGGAKKRPECYVEIKNTTMRDGDFSAFPDARTERGQKHLEELARMVEQGKRAVMFFFIGRSDCKRFRPAYEIDPEYGAALRDAASRGVELLAYRMKFTLKGIELLNRAEIVLG